MATWHTAAGLTKWRAIAADCIIATVVTPSVHEDNKNEWCCNLVWPAENAQYVCHKNITSKTGIFFINKITVSLLHTAQYAFFSWRAHFILSNPNAHTYIPVIDTVIGLLESLEKCNMLLYLDCEGDFLVCIYIWFRVQVKEVYKHGHY